MWLLQLRDGVKQGLKCGFGHPARAAGSWLFPSPGCFFPHFPSVTQQFSFCLSSQAQHRLIPIPAGDTLQRHPCSIQKSSLPVPGKLEVWSEQRWTGKPLPALGQTQLVQPAEEIIPPLWRCQDHPQSPGQLCPSSWGSQGWVFFGFGGPYSCGSQGWVFFAFGGPCLSLAEIKSAGRLQAVC